MAENRGSACVCQGQDPGIAQDDDYDVDLTPGSPRPHAAVAAVRLSAPDFSAHRARIDVFAGLVETSACSGSAPMSSKYIGRTALGFARAWHHVDVARDPRPLGRLATSIAVALQGKHKPVYYEGSDCGDYVVVTNCQHIYTTGKKDQYKLYRWHSGRPGNLHEMSLRDLKERKGGSEILRRAVSGMLPKNQLREHRLDRLKLVEGSENPWAGNVIAFHDDAVAKQ